MKDYHIYLEDILESIEKIERYLHGVKPAGFGTNDSLQDSIIRRLAIIGEAVKQLPTSVTEKYPTIPWKKIAGMRDILVHDYAGVQIERVWRTTQNDLPKLKQVVTKIKEQK